MAAVRITVADVASLSPIKIREEAAVREAASLMASRDEGCIVVVDREDRPVGIVTEGDLVSKVLAKGLDPEELKVKDVMSTPVITVRPSDNVIDALKIMSKMKIHHLVVVSGGKAAGIVSDRDIIRVTPALVEILAEKAFVLEAQSAVVERMAGYCDNCEEWSENLTRVDEQMLCEECRLEYGIERG